MISAGPGRPAHEVDVITVAGREVSLIGEAKATIAAVGRTELHRLDRIAGILTDQQRDATQAIRAIFSMRGFRDDLVREARERGDVLLVDLPALVGTTGPVVAPRPGQVGRW